MVSPSAFLSTNSFTLIICFLLCGPIIVRTVKGETEVISRPDIVTSIEKDLEFDENQRLAKHYVVFPANRPNCGTASWENGTGEFEFEPSITARALEGDALEKVFSKEQDDNTCMAACLEKGTDIKVAGHAMPHFHYQSEGTTPLRETKKLEKWVHRTCDKVEVCFINYAVIERPLKVFWINEQEEPKTKKSQGDLRYGESNTYCFHSFLGHTFEALDEKSGFFETITIEHATTKAFGTSPPSSSQKFDGIDELEANVKTTLVHEWDRHKMVARTFSSLGFAKGKLPDDVFANMGAFYYNNRNNIVNEEWDGKGLFVNWWDTDVKFLPIPWAMKQRWQLRLSDMVSEWSGVEVEETSMYGLRQYEGGARLLSHVDRIPTHAVSLIVNIAQTNLASPWPVEVFDHGDRLHEVIMDPGDVVYYESAKNLHSRNRPLTCKEGGCAYINLFTHYRPVADGAKWHRNLKDMPNRPPPLVQGDVDFDREPSACRLPEQPEENNTGNTVGVGTVECNDARLGSHLSPTLFRLESAKDLFRWWKATKDPNFIAFDKTDTNTDDFLVNDTLRYDDEYDFVEDDDDDDGEDDDDDSIPAGSDGKEEL